MDLETNEYMNMKVIKMCDVMLNVWFVIEHSIFRKDIPCGDCLGCVLSKDMLNEIS